MRANQATWHLFGRPHGTAARARKHYRDGDRPCPACYEAQRQARRLSAARLGRWKVTA